MAITVCVIMFHDLPQILTIHQLMSSRDQGLAADVDIEGEPKWCNCWFFKAYELLEFELCHKPDSSSIVVVVVFPIWLSTGPQLVL